MFAMFNRRLLIEYLLMVGLPLLLLLGVLQRGRGLEAPAAVHGSWRLAVDESPGPASPCEERLGNLNGSLMEITQSGNYLDASVRSAENTALRGRSEGRSLWLESVPRENSVLNGDLLRLTGTVANAGGGRVIQGTLLMPRLVDCAPRGFRALSPEGAGQARQGKP
jgi:hypothetical protein